MGIIVTSVYTAAFAAAMVVFAALSIVFGFFRILVGIAALPAGE